ncbi:DUF2946 family protein [Noviherbaspirillum aridicola]|uniref:DUF2946 family protein n=1 Tax=Noviherbaspirillum aridicola TaxID=2849687 RepID=A0ABQ4Q7W6_9BURK|nr:DUF2946 family protein [Noviherbaspirillum aridicola]GIZ53295.1 hypothetical protein NCCP691_33090 [Noviherbaspirillum aridicola]
MGSARGFRLSFTKYLTLSMWEGLCFDCESNFALAMTLNRVLRTVLLYLLMALLPLGGMANVRAACGKPQAASAEATAHIPCDKPGAAHTGHDTSKPDKSSHSHASANCGMCFVSTPAPATASLHVAVAESRSAFPPASSAFAEFIPPGPDRPPR